MRPDATDLDSAASFCIPVGVLEVLVPVFQASLDASDEQTDTWVGRDLMVLTNRIHADADGGKTILMLSKVYKHSLWSKVTFWEEVLMIGLCEAHAVEATVRRTLAAGSQFTQPALTPFLKHFLGYMMAFGISYDQARNSVLSTLRKNSQTFGHSCKAYATLLLQSYEESAAPVGTSGIAGSPDGSVGGFEASTPNTWADVTPMEAGAEDSSVNPAADLEEDFEAIAFGLGVGVPSGETMRTDATAPSENEDGSRQTTLVDGQNESDTGGRTGSEVEEPALSRVSSDVDVFT